MKSKLKNLLCIALVCITIFSTSCTKKESAPDKSTDNKPTSTIVATDKIKESEGNPTNSETPESTAKPTATANNNTPSAPSETEKPTNTPIVTPKPIITPTKKPVVTADPAVYPDDYGSGSDNNEIRYSSEAIFWTDTRELVEVPDSLPWPWRPEYIDEGTRQIFIATGKFAEGTLAYYSLVDGEFYKLSQGKIIEWSSYYSKQWAWVEESGTAYSVGVRTSKYNEVYVEGYNATGCFFDMGILYVGNKQEITRGITENILVNIKQLK